MTMIYTITSREDCTNCETLCAWSFDKDTAIGMAHDFAARAWNDFEIQVHRFEGDTTSPTTELVFSIRGKQECPETADHDETDPMFN